MSVIPVTFQQAKCDTCGGLYEDPDNGSAFEDRGYALEVAADSGWSRDGDQLTCPSCLRCARCAASPAWVGGEQLEPHGQILCESCDPGPVPVCDCGTCTAIRRTLGRAPGDALR